MCAYSVFPERILRRSDHQNFRTFGRFHEIDEIIGGKCLHGDCK